MAVVNGVTDAAAIDELVLYSMYPEKEKRDKKVRTIWLSDTYGPPPIVVPKGLEPELKASLQRELLNLHKDPAAGELLKSIGIERFAPPDAQSYSSIIKLYRSGQKTGE